MREIKFRAWDGRQMLAEGLVFSNGYWFRDYRDFENAVFLDAVVMQYTGVKDDNGCPVYEGDVVRCWGGEQWSGVWEMDWVVLVEDLRDLGCLMAPLHVEVLGNIHENPGLFRSVVVPVASVQEAPFE